VIWSKRLVGVAAALALLTACPIDGPTPPPPPLPPNGVLGRALFLASPLAERARVTVSAVTCVPVASAEVSADATVISSREAPASAETTTGCESGSAIELQTGAPGPVTLTLRDGTGAEIDHFELRVAAVQTIEFEPPAARVFASNDVSLAYRLLDAAGALLAGCPTATVASTGGVTAPVVGGACGDCGSVCLHADSPGAGSVMMTVGAASATLPVDVVAPTAATGISLDSTSGSFPVGWRGLAATYRYEVPGGPVHGTACTWVSADPTVADCLPDSFRPNLLGSAAAGNLGVRALAPGATTLDCVIASGARASYRMTVTP